VLAHTLTPGQGSRREGGGGGSYDLFLVNGGAPALCLPTHSHRARGAGGKEEEEGAMTSFW
jgi:hypothetical protein